VSSIVETANLSAAEPALRATPTLHCPNKRRGLRTHILLGAIIAMSLGDLWMTLQHLQMAGMSEGNPLARYIISLGSPTILVAWKCASVALTCLILHFFRTRRSAEVAAWFCTLVLAALTVKWVVYSQEISALTGVIHAVQDVEYSNWVRLDGE
jgi:hypothetical protein